MRYFKINSILTILLFVTINSYSQGYSERNAPLTVSKEKKIEGKSQKKIYKTILKFIDNRDDINIVKYNDSKFMIVAEGVMPYHNEVVLENVFLSKDANLRTKGVIKFTIDIAVKETGEVTFNYSKFRHEAFYSRYGEISFGEILTNEKVPLNKCFEHTQWCNEVWAEMKTKIRRQSAKVWLDLQKEFE